MKLKFFKWRYTGTIEQKSRLYSGLVHFVIFILIIFGLPSFESHKIPSEIPSISVEMVQLPQDLREPEEKKPIQQKQPPKPVIQKVKKPTPQPKPVVSQKQRLRNEKKPVPVPAHTNRKTQKQPPKPTPKPRKDPPKPKPEPPKHEPKEPQKSFDNLLDDLTKTATPKPQPKPQKKVNMSLNASDIDKVREKIRENWIIPHKAQNSNISVVLLLSLTASGAVQSVKIVETSGDADKTLLQMTAIAAERAVKRASPLPFPKEKYKLWQRVELTLTP